MEAGRLLWLGCTPAHAVSRQQHVGHVILAIDGHDALLCCALLCLACCAMIGSVLLFWRRRWPWKRELSTRAGDECTD